MMDAINVKKKALQAVKSFGREGMGGMLKKGYGPESKKPAIAISIEATKGAPDEEMEGEGMMPPEMLKKHEGMEPMGVRKAEGEYGSEYGSEHEHEMQDGSVMKDSAMSEDKSGAAQTEITPELLEMLLAKLGK